MDFLEGISQFCKMLMLCSISPYQQLFVVFAVYLWLERVLQHVYGPLLPIASMMRDFPCSLMPSSCFVVRPGHGMFQPKGRELYALLVALPHGATICN